jgi:hypothetical protein
MSAKAFPYALYGAISDNKKIREKFRLLGYKNPVRTSQETHYPSATESSRLMLCKFWLFHGGDYKNAIFWDVTSCDSCKNRRFWGMSPIPVTLIKEGLSCSETSVYARATRRNIQEDGFLRSHRHENLNWAYVLGFFLSFLRYILQPLVSACEVCMQTGKQVRSQYLENSRSTESFSIEAWSDSQKRPYVEALSMLRNIGGRLVAQLGRGI